jgi:[acyl-carrier-protein] S-malonyltransferase
VGLSVAVVFPGQGAQAPGLGDHWRDHDAWSIVERAEKATGLELAPLLLEAPAKQLTRTRDAQLVVLLASLLAWEAAGARLDGVATAYAGHSLGQVSALIAAGALSFDDGVRLAARRAELTQACADARPQAMAALLGATPEQATEACAGSEAWLANDNGGGQVAIAGTPEGVAAAGERAKELGVTRVIPLNVGGAFHTPLMQPAADGMLEAVANATFEDTATPVLSNTDAAAHTDGADWPTRLVEHLVRPVRWRETMDAFGRLGIDVIVEVGPGSTLTNLAKRALPGARLVNIAVPQDLDRLDLEGAIT